LMTAIAKSAELGFWKGIANLTWKKLKPLGITLIISLVFAQIYFWIHIVDDFGDPFGFMWYIEWLIVVPIVYYAIFYLLKKNKKIFLVCVSVIVIVSYILLSVVCQSWGILRGFSGIGIGILLSQLPKLKLNFKKFDFSILISIALIVATFVCAMYCRYILYHNHLFILLLFPALLYFANCIDNCHFVVFDYLGSLSFGMYAYQTLNRLHDKENNLALFSIVMGLAILDNLIRRLISYHKDGQ